MRFALILVFCASAFAQVDDTPRMAPDIPRDVVWLDQGAPVPHTMKEYRGRVVLVDFWEYTCINCIRDFAVVKRWYAKYHRYGFEVLGVHFGEFQIGFNPDNVSRAAQSLRLPWPVLADVKGSMWKAFYSNVWPNRYLIDSGGSIVLQVEGEGNNTIMEKQIRDLLAKKHPEVKSIALDPEEASFAPQCGIATQETYVGKWFNRGAIENSGAYHGKEKTDTFQPDKTPKDGGVMLKGTWKVEQDGATNLSNKQQDEARLRYHARSVYAVLGASDPAKPERVYILQDEKPLDSRDAGRDVKYDDWGGYVEVGEPRMYDLVRNTAPAEQDKNRLPQHTLTLNPASPGLKIFSFTYGNNCQQNF